VILHVISCENLPDNVSVTVFQTLKMLSKLQKSTRQLQALCAHGKLQRYVRLCLFFISHHTQLLYPHPHFSFLLNFFYLRSKYSQCLFLNSILLLLSTYNIPFPFPLPLHPLLLLLYSDRQLSMEAPGIRKSLERLIYRMKAMVAGSEHRESKQVWVRMCVVCVCVYDGRG
jgi:hypothetical protein